MFSMMPFTGRLTLAAIAADSRATFCAAGCGVVTTYTSPRGRYWLRQSAMSPVPGGMSIEQEVGVVPEHVGEELLERLVQHRPAPDDGLALGHEVADRDAAARPYASGGTSISSMTTGSTIGAEHPRDRVAVDVGVDDADRVALRARATARLTVTLYLPTPPLPDEMSSGRVLRPGLGERDLATLGVTVGLALAGGGARRCRAA